MAKQDEDQVEQSSIMDQDDLNEDKNNEAPKKKRGRKPKKPEPKFPAEPRVIQIVNKPKSFMNHSYRDFSQVPPEEGEVVPTKIEDMNFAQKVHAILSEPAYEGMISWLPHGRAFKVLVPKQLESNKVLFKYFGHNRYSSFLRQLNNHGFKHLTAGVDRNAYYHEFMLRGLPHLCKYMPEARDARRLTPDPENEPDFYSISRVFPLPDEEKKVPAPVLLPAAPTMAPPLQAVKPVALEVGPAAKLQAIASSMHGSNSSIMRQSPALDVSQVRNVLLGNDAAVKALAAGLQTELFASQRPVVQQPPPAAPSNQALDVLAAYLRAASQGNNNGLGL